MVMTLPVRHGSHGPSIHRWFTYYKNSGSFHGELLVIQGGAPQL